MTKFRSRVPTLALATFAAASALVGGLAIFGSPPLFKPRPQSSPVIQTDKAAYLAGEAIEISGSGFTPLERVMLQVKHAGGTTENGAGHEAWFVNADQDGSFTSKWTISSGDDAGVNLVVTAAGSSRSTAQAEFARVAAFSTRVRSYKPGDTVQVHASGFNPNQLVTIQVNNQDAFTTQTDQSGQATASLKIPEGSSAGSLSLRAVAPQSGLVSSNIVISDAQAVFSAAAVATLFQLDGDAASLFPTGATGHDWNQVYSDFIGTIPKTSGTGAINFYTDPILNDDSLTGGNSKDNNDLNVWTYGLATPQNKANLEHAIAAAYVDPNNGHTYLYVGADRFDNGGSIALGAWFLQSPIVQSGGKFYTANPNGTPNLTSPAHHMNGDLLLVANFSGGGGSATITAYTWNNGFSATGTTLSSNIGTAIVNTVPLDGASGHPPAVPWPFTSSTSGTASQYVQIGEFFEAGVDLNLLFPTQTNFNFSTFMAETRSSTSTNATLSDFILGHVSTAPDVAVTKVADSSAVYAGSQVGFTVTVENVGVGGDLNNVTLNDPLPSGANNDIVWSIATGGNPNFVLNGITAGNQSLSLPSNFTLANLATMSVHIVGTSSNSDVGTLTNTATVTAGNEGPNFSSNNQATATIEITAPPAGLTIVKRIVNDNGGTLAVDSFGITTDAGALIFGPGIADGPGTLKYTATALTGLSAGSKSLHENTVTGYTEGTWGCVGAAGAVNGNAQSGSVVLAAGESVTCTITNNDQAPHLTLAKHVNNTHGGTADASAWTLTAAGDGGFSGTGLPAPGPDASKTADVKAAVEYTLSESGGPSSGYTSTGIWSCTAGVFESPNKVTLALNQSATCTITNDDRVAQLIIIKVVDNNTNGDGGLTAPSFSGTISGVTATGDNTWTGALTSKTLTTVGSYTVAEDAHPGYDVSFGPDCVNATIGLGETKTCTVTNTAQKATPGGTTTQLLQDKLTITGLRTGASPAGFVNFRLYKENDTNDGCTDANEVGNGLNLNRPIENGVASTGTGVAVGPGTYYWRAEYTGDQYNNGFTTACKSEVVTVVN